MKEVTFQYKILGGRQNGRTIFGTITEKATGKPSVSIAFAREFHNTDVWKAKKLAQQIIESGFEHPAITSVKEVKAELLDMLKKHTAKMRDLYYQRVKEDAKKEFKWLQECNGRSLAEWYKSFGVETEEINRFGKTVIEPKSAEYNKKGLYKMRDAKDYAKRVVNDGLPTFLEKAQKAAEHHYEQTTVKLAHRITDKGFDTDKITVTSGMVGINLEVDITDGIKKVKCFTIIAEGEVQKAHYRYLIKDKK